MNVPDMYQDTKIATFEWSGDILWAVVCCRVLSY